MQEVFAQSECLVECHQVVQEGWCHLEGPVEGYQAACVGSVVSSCDVYSREGDIYIFIYIYTYIYTYIYLYLYIYIYIYVGKRAIFEFVLASIPGSDLYIKYMIYDIYLPSIPDSDSRFQFLCTGLNGIYE